MEAPQKRSGEWDRSSFSPRRRLTPGNNNSSSTHSEEAGKKKLGQANWFFESAGRTGAAESEWRARGALWVV